MNLIKTLSPFFCLGFIFQLTNLKLTDLEKKGTISASNNHLAREGLGLILRQTPFDPGKIIKIAMKSIRTTKGAIITSFWAIGENYPSV